MGSTAAVWRAVVVWAAVAALGAVAVPEPAYTAITDPVVFDGTTYVPLDTVPSLSDSFSIRACYANQDLNSFYFFANQHSTTKDQRCFALFVSASANQYAIFYGDYDGASYSNRYSSNSFSVDSQSWVSMVTVVQGNRLYFYTQGSLLSAHTLESGTSISTCTEGVAVVGIRYNNGGLGFPMRGIMSDVTFYDSALTSSEIAASFANCDADQEQHTHTILDSGVVELNGTVVDGTVRSARFETSLVACLRLEPGSSGFLLSNEESGTGDACLQWFVAGTYMSVAFGAVRNTIETVTSPSTLPLSDGRWHTVALALRATDVEFFVDGVSYGTAAVTTSAEFQACTTGTTTIGSASDGTNAVDGATSNMRMFTYRIASSSAHLVVGTCQRSFTLVPDVTQFSASSASALAVDDIPSLGPDLTLLACVKQTALNRGYVFANQRSTGSDDRRCLALLLSDDRAYLFYGGEDSSTRAASDVDFVVDDGQWHHIAVVVDDTTVSFYLDGTLHNSQTIPATSSLRTCRSGAAAIGMRYPAATDAFDGYMTRVLAYDVVLSESDIQLATTCVTEDLSAVITTNAPNGYTNVPITAVVTFTRSVTSFKTYFITVGGTAGATLADGFSEVSADNTQFQVQVASVSGDGTITLQVPAGVASDEFGNTNLASSLVTVELSRAALTATIVTDARTTSLGYDVTNNPSITATVTFSDHVTGLSAGELAVSGDGVKSTPHAITQITNAQYSITVSLSVLKSSLRFTVGSGVVKDKYGNRNRAATAKLVEFELSSVVLNITAPDTTINDPTVQIQFSFNKRVYSFEPSDVVVAMEGGEVTVASEFTGNLEDTYYLELYAVGNGNLTVSVAAGVCEDLYGNLNLLPDDLGLELETRPPTATLSVPDTTVNFDPINITIAFDRVVKVIDTTDPGIVLYYSGGYLNASALSPASGFSSEFVFSTELSGVSTAEIVVSVEAGHFQDLFENANEAADPLVISYDTVRPTVQITTNASETPEGIDATNTLALTAYFTFSKDVVGMEIGSINITGPNVSAADILSFEKFSDSIYWAVVNIANINADVLYITVAEGAALDVNENPSEASSQKGVEVNRVPLVTTITTNAEHLFRGELVDSTNQRDVLITVEFTKTAGDPNVTTFLAYDITVQGGGSYLQPHFYAGGPHEGSVYTILGSSVWDDGQRVYRVAAGATEDKYGNKNLAADDKVLGVDASDLEAAITTSAFTAFASPALVDLGSNLTVVATITFNKDVEAPAAGTFKAFGCCGLAATDVHAITEVSPSVFTITVTASSTGSLNFSFPINATVDQYGNDNVAVLSKTVELDRTTLEVNITTDAFACLSNPIEGSVCDDATFESSFTATITFSRSVINFNATSISVGGDPGGAVWPKLFLTGSTDRVFLVSVVANGDGDLTLSLPQGSVTDVYGNSNLVSNSRVVTIDSVPLEVLVVSSAVDDATNHPLINFTITFTKNAEAATVYEFLRDDLVVSPATAILADDFSFSSLNEYRITVNATADAVVELTVPAGAAVDIAKNPSVAVTKSVTFDATGPAAPVVSSNPPGPSAATQYNITVVFAEVVYNFDVSGANVTDMVLGTPTTDDSTVFVVPATIAADARPARLVFVEGTAFDAVGNPSEPSAVLELYREVPAVGAVEFTDVDCGTRVVSGTLRFVVPAYEDGVEGFRLYWGSDASTKNSTSPFKEITVAKAQGTYEVELSGEAMSSGATHILVYSFNEVDQESVPSAHGVYDVRPPLLPPLSTGPFVDEDCEENKLGGVLVVEPAADSGDTHELVVYLSSNSSLQGQQATLLTVPVSTTSVDLAGELGGAVDIDASVTHFVVVGKRDQCAGIGSDFVSTPVNDEYSPPLPPSGLSAFVDEDCRWGHVTGDLTLSAAANNESLVDEYLLYWAVHDSDGDLLTLGGAFAWWTANGSSSYELSPRLTRQRYPTLPHVATHIAGVSKRGLCERRDSYAEIEINDRQTPTSLVSAVAIADDDNNRGEVMGTVTITAPDTTVVSKATDALFTHYNLYWGNDDDDHQELIALNVEATSTTTTYSGLEGTTTVPPCVAEFSCRLYAFTSHGPHCEAAAASFVEKTDYDADSEPPKETAQYAELVDGDCTLGVVGAVDFTVTRAANEVDIDGYHIYLGSSASEKLKGHSYVATAEKPDQIEPFLQVPLVQDPTTLPTGATHYLVYSYVNSITSGDQVETTVPFAVPLEDVHPPLYESQGIVFDDVDCDQGYIQGNLTVLPALYEATTDGYRLYYADSSGAILESEGVLGQWNKGTDEMVVEFAANTPVPTNAANFVVQTYNEACTTIQPLTVRIEDTYNPETAANAIDFADVDGHRGELGGVIAVSKPFNEDETIISRYRLYWAAGDAKVAGLEAFKEFHKDDELGSLHFTFDNDTLVPETATHFAVFTAAGSQCEMSRGVFVPITDLDTVPPKYLPYLNAQPFFDDDCREGVVGGSLEIVRADPETGIDQYRVYFGADNTTRQELCYTVKMGGVDVETCDDPAPIYSAVVPSTSSVSFTAVVPPTAIPNGGATHLLVYSYNAVSDLENPTAVAMELVDNFHPNNQPSSVFLSDQDTNRGEVSGIAYVEGAADETDITAYALYWGFENLTKSDSTPFVVIDKEDMFAEVAQDTAIPAFTTTILAFSRKSGCEMATPASAPLHDAQEAAPKYGAVSASFTDTVCEEGTIGGTVTVEPPALDLDVDEFRVYFSDGSSKVSTTEIATVDNFPGTGASVHGDMTDVVVPSGATHLLVSPWVFNPTAQQFLEGDSAQFLVIGFEDVHTPTAVAQSVSFEDVDISEGQLQGEVVVVATSANSSLTHYELWFADDYSEPEEFVARLESNDTMSFTFGVDTFPSGSRLLVLAAHDACLAHSGVSLGFADLIEDAARAVEGLALVETHANNFTVSWSSDDYASRYNVFVANSTGEWVALHDGDVTALSFTAEQAVGGWSDGEEITVRVVPGGQHSFNEASAATLEVVPTDSPPSTKPSLRIQSISGSTATLSFFSPAATFYNVVLYSSAGSEVQTVETTSTQATLSDLSEGEEYTVRVFAGNNHGTQSTSQAASGTLIPTSGAVQDQALTVIRRFSVSSTSVTLQLWHPSATSFDVYQTLASTTTEIGTMVEAGRVDVDGLTAGSTYLFSVVAHNSVVDDFNITHAASLYATPTGSAPEEIASNARVTLRTSSGVTIAFDDSASDATFYTVELSNTSLGWSDTLFASLTDTEFQISHLAMDTDFGVTITGGNDHGVSAVSTTVPVRLTSAPPQDRLRHVYIADNTNHSTTIVFDLDAESSYYQCEVWVNAASSWVALQSSPTTHPTFTLAQSTLPATALALNMSVERGATLDLRLRAGNTGGLQSETLSRLFSVTPWTGQPPSTDVPELFLDHVTSSSVQLYTHSLTGTHHRIDVLVDGAWEEAGQTTTGVLEVTELPNAFRDAVEEGTVYEFRSVNGLANDAGTVEWQDDALASATLMAQPASTAPAAVANLRLLQVNMSSVVLSWDADTTATHFAVYRREYNEPANFDFELRSDQVYTNEYEVSVDETTAFQFAVVAVNNHGALEPSEASVIVAQGAQTTPQSASDMWISSAASGSSSSVTLYFTNPTATHFQVLWKLSSAASFSVGASQTDATSLQLSSLTAGATYLFQVLAYNGYGLQNDTLAATREHTIAGSAVPTDSVQSLRVVRVGEQGVQVAWTFPEDADRALVQVREPWVYPLGEDEITNTPPFRNVSVVHRNSATILSLITNTRYTVRVFAGNEHGFEIDGRTVEAVPTQQVQDGVTTLWLSLLRPTTVSLFWTAVPDATTYTVEMKNNDTDTEWTTVVSELAQLAHDVTHLSSNHTYAFRVVPFNANGEAQEEGNTVYATPTGFTPADPVPLSGIRTLWVSSSTITIQWEGVLDAFVYRVVVGTGQPTIESSLYTTTTTVSIDTPDTDMSLTIYAGNNYGFSTTGTTYTERAQDVPSAPATSFGVYNASATSVSLQWDAVTGADRYLVQGRLDGSCARSTVSGPVVGRSCVFPFSSGGVLYSACTTFGNGDVEWCATSVSEDGVMVSGQWGNCNECEWYDVAQVGPESVRYEPGLTATSVVITSLNNSPLSTSAPYVFRIFAGNFAGFESTGAYAWRPITPSSAAPSAGVTDLRVTALTSSTARLEWTLPHDAFYSQIEQASQELATFNFGGEIGDGWTLVRRVHAGSQWHPATDDLAGTDVYGAYSSRLTCPQTFSVAFSSFGVTDILFATGDMRKWLITTPSVFATASATAVAANVSASHVQSTAYTANWYVRGATNAEDPLVSASDYSTDDALNNVLYQEAAYTQNAHVLQLHSGANVFVRGTSVPSQSFVQSGTFALDGTMARVSLSDASHVANADPTTDADNWRAGAMAFADLTGLSTGAQVFRVTAHNAFGASTAMEVLVNPSDAAPASVVPLLTAVASGDSWVLLEWGVEPTAFRYLVEAKAVDADDGQYTAVSDGLVYNSVQRADYPITEFTGRFTVEGLAQGTTYSFRVTPGNDQGWGSSAEISATTTSADDTTALGAVSDLIVVDTYNGFATLQWTALPGNFRFRVWYRRSSETSDAALLPVGGTELWFGSDGLETFQSNNTAQFGSVEYPLTVGDSQFKVQLPDDDAGPWEIVVQLAANHLDGHPTTNDVAQTNASVTIGTGATAAAPSDLVVVASTPTSVTLQFSSDDNAFKYKAEWALYDQDTGVFGSFDAWDERFLTCKTLPCQHRWEVEGLEYARVYQFRLSAANYAGYHDAATAPTVVGGPSPLLSSELFVWSTTLSMPDVSVLGEGAVVLYDGAGDVDASHIALASPSFGSHEDMDVSIAIVGGSSVVVGIARCDIDSGQPLDTTNSVALDGAVGNVTGLGVESPVAVATFGQGDSVRVVVASGTLSFYVNTLVASVPLVATEWEWCVAVGDSTAGSAYNATITSGGVVSRDGTVPSNVADLHVHNTTASSVTLVWTPDPTAFLYAVEFAAPKLVNSTTMQATWVQYPDYQDGNPDVTCATLSDASEDCTANARIVCPTLPCYRTFTVEGLDDTTLYTFRVWSGNTNGFAPSPPTFAAAPTAVAPTQAVTDLRAVEVRASYIDVRWTPVVTALEYQVIRENPADGAQTVVRDRLLCNDGANPFHTDQLAQCDTQLWLGQGDTIATTGPIAHTIDSIGDTTAYVYIVRGVNGYGSGPGVNITQAAVAVPASPVTDLVVLEVTASSMTLSWTVVADATYYDVQVRREEEDDSAYQTVATQLDAPPYTIQGPTVFANGNGTYSGLTTLHAYTVRIVAGNDNGLAATGTTLTDFPHPKPVGSAYDLLVANATATSVALVWKVPDDTTARWFVVEHKQRTQADSAFVEAAASPTAGLVTGFVVTGLEEGGEHVFRVRGVNLAGVEEEPVERVYWFMSDTPHVGPFLSLLRLYESTLGASDWVNADNWATANALGATADAASAVPAMCALYGVTCANASVPATFLAAQPMAAVGCEPDDDGHCQVVTVQSLVLARNELYGTIPPEIGQLWMLRELDLSKNHVFGTIPIQLGHLARLEWLDLHMNDLAGALPVSVGQLARVSIVDVTDNDLSGEVEPEVQHMASLEFLALSANKFSGSVPAFLSALSNLTTVDLSFNAFAGTVPTELFALPLAWLSLSHNTLSGSVPPEIGQLTHATHVLLDHNALVGPMPRALGNAVRLRVLDLGHNAIHSTVVTELRQLELLRALYLDNNALEGSIPPQLGDLHELEELYLDGNALSGDLPEWGVADWPVVERLWVQGNALTGQVPESFGSLLTLRQLRAEGNKLYTTLPWTLGNLTNLEVLRLEGNRDGSGSGDAAAGGVHGTVPTELGLLTSLVDLRLSANSLEGTIPLELQALVQLQYLHLADNALNGSVFDELALAVPKLKEFSCHSNQLYGRLHAHLHAACECSSCVPEAQVCGDGITTGTEECDDGNTDSVDGCASDCKLEPGWACSQDYFGLTTCAEVCGDGVRTISEECDTGAGVGTLGCSASCLVNVGWACNENDDLLSVCEVVCGDGIVLFNETCDDANTKGSDGCSEHCLVETGWDCEDDPRTVTVSGMQGPSVCFEVCGDGVRTASEQCDDGNQANFDGCDVRCGVEFGWVCDEDGAALSACREVCGNGLISPSEECDDGGVVDGDGCSAGCTVEHGWECVASPLTSVCTENCGNGVRTKSEACDDNNAVANDGCTDCTVDQGWYCTTHPQSLRSVCAQRCGDGNRTQSEQCDDGNDDFNDGCERCRVQHGWTCSEPSGELGPSVCVEHCTNGVKTRGEECDDGDPFTADDGCLADCSIEHGWVCVEDINGLSSCDEVCGNGITTAFEECDDGNTVSGDGCSSVCREETGWDCTIVDFLAFCVDRCGDSVNNSPDPTHCDDGNLNNGDGCSDSCEVEYGWVCENDDQDLSVCSKVCGNGILTTGEECDDANQVSGDGCSYGDCLVEANFICSNSAAPSVCCAVAYGVDYSGLQLEVLSGVASEAECCRRCTAHAICDRWVFFLGAQSNDFGEYGDCWLKKATSSEIALDRNHPSDFDYDALASGVVDRS